MHPFCKKNNKKRTTQWMHPFCKKTTKNELHSECIPSVKKSKNELHSECIPSVKKTPVSHKKWKYNTFEVNRLVLVYS